MLRKFIYIASVIAFFFLTEYKALSYHMVEPCSKNILLPIDSPELEMPYPIKEQDNYFNNSYENNMDLGYPSNIEKDVIYDPDTKEYILTQKYGDEFFRDPTFMSFNDFIEMEYKKNEMQYWEEKSETSSLLNRKMKFNIEKFKKENPLENLFPSNFIEIKPTGSIDLTLGGFYQKVDNPIFNEKQRRQGGFNFDMNIQANVVGSIGDLINLNFNYNTKADFDFENKIKLGYEGKEDQIIKQIEAGNVSLPLQSSLITGSQSLFGIKTKLQFGRLSVTSVISQQEGSTENIQVQGGAQTKDFEIQSNNYDYNRHFFIGHYFRDNYEKSLENLPIVSSEVNITKIEVWITNKTGTTNNTRDIIAFMDLAETDSIEMSNQISSTKQFPENEANNLYDEVNIPSVRNTNTAITSLIGLGYQSNMHFEKTYARKLNESEFNYHPQLGYISLNQRLNPDEVLAISYEYTYRGDVLRVGEFAQDIPPGSNNDGILITKMLKSTSVNPKLKMWDLMMKNIYSLNAYQINNKDFFLNIYYQDPGGGIKRYIPKGSVNGIPLIRLLDLDKLNTQTDPMPDGLFDFVPGITIDARKGKLIFTQLEPFADGIRNSFENGEASIAEKYAYDELYDSTWVIAEQFPEYNRYLIKGTYISSISSEISLNRMNVPKGSVKVTAGGRVLQEGTDYSVDYLLGRVKILNEGIMNSGAPINVSFESSDLFGIQQKTMIGTRLDYWINDNFTLGATAMRLRETPLTAKINFGDEPIKNTIWGFDGNYNTELPGLTKFIDKLPFIETKAPSQVTITGEYAQLNPGHPKIIGEGGTTYIDDFEGTRSFIDLKMPVINWKLSSTPKGDNSSKLFPEAELFDSLDYGKNRAKMTWYSVDNVLTRTTNNPSIPDHLKEYADSAANGLLDMNIYIREVVEQEVFPNKQSQTGYGLPLPTMNITYYPNERGPYNYDDENIDSEGFLNDPEDRWGGIMQDIQTTDFEASNVEYIEFWLLDPFYYNDEIKGDLYINLGNVSEDVLRDGRKLFENGLPKNSDYSSIDTTNWGFVPITQPITNSFDNDADARPLQDVGYDGLTDENEQIHFADFLSNIQSKVNSTAYNALLNDPSNDNYHYYKGSDYDNEKRFIIERYKNFNNPDGNSPINSGGESTSATNLPDSEDLNFDNTLSESEDYFQYKIRIAENEFEIGKNFITDKVSTTPANWNSLPISWYQFKIPITEFNNRVGNISDFRSIRFIRMFLTGFTETVNLRFARIGLVRNQWRKYNYSLASPGEYISDDNGNETYFDISVANIEENSEREPIPYVLPDSIFQEEFLTTATNSFYKQNEQSLSLKVCELKDGDSKAAYRNLVLDMRNFKRARMFIHAEDIDNSLNDGDLSAFIRIGSDYTSNYYEYEVPLKYSPHNSADPKDIWPRINEINIPLDSFPIVKNLRNLANANNAFPYSVKHGSNNNSISVVGSPDLGRVKTFMLGIRNPKIGSSTIPDDDGLNKCGEVWFNELRLEGFDERGGSAALARVDLKLADLGNMSVSGNMHTIGFGGIEQSVSERYRDNFYQYDASSSIDIGKLTPKFIGLNLPFFASISESFSNPQYDPYDSDIELKDKLLLIENDSDLSAEAKKESIKATRDAAQSYTGNKSLNFSNIRFSGGKGKADSKKKKTKKKRFYDPKNFNLSYSFIETEKRDPIIKSDKVKTYNGNLGYSFSHRPKSYKPFNKLLKTKWKYLKPIKDFNFTLMPSNLTFQSGMNRQFGELQLRSIGDEIAIEPTYNKFFDWSRKYDLKYKPAKSINLNFNANANARIDEPEGKIDEEWEKDSIIYNIMNMGRILSYDHKASANYKLPLNKLPLTNWINVNLKYNTGYKWNASSLVMQSWGNIIQNNNTKQINASLNTRTLYNNFKKLNKQLDKLIKPDKEKKEKKKDKLDEENMDNMEKEGFNKKIRDKERIQDIRKKKKKKKQTIGGKIFEKLITGVKTFSVNYTENEGTTLPGFMPSPEVAGQSLKYSAPGPAFIFGYQPNDQWLEGIAKIPGILTTDTLMNHQLLRNKSFNLNARAAVEPIKGFRIDLSMKSDFSISNTEFFKDTIGDGNQYVHLNPVSNGNMKVSFIAWNTIFDSEDANGISETFKTFEKNREIISERLSYVNPSSGLTPHDTLPGYYNGYGSTSQDVLIPAFMAAYTGQNVNEININSPIRQKPLPLPNWRIRYSGLSKIKALKKIFKSITISHSYSSTFSINSFQSSLLFEDIDGFPSNKNEITENYYPEYEISQITISEQLAPLIGIDVRLQNNLTAKFNYQIMRTLNMSFLNYQLGEQKSKEIKLGIGYKIRGLKLPFKFGTLTKLKNELTCKFDFAIRDSKNMIHKLDQNISEPTGGTKMISLLPSADYILNKNISLRFFFDWKKTIPYTSTSYPITNMNTGITLRYTL